jgi:hypothetical protein
MSTRQRSCCAAQPPPQPRHGCTSTLPLAPRPQPCAVAAPHPLPSHHPSPAARIHPEKALGVAIGDIHVVRNAGGRAVDALRSVTISQQLLGTTEVGGGAGSGCW